VSFAIAGTVRRPLLRRNRDRATRPAHPRYKWLMEQPSDLTAHDPEAFGRAAREAMRAQVVAELERRDLANSPELETCPRCGDRIIHRDVASTYVKDRAHDTLICAPCGTEQSVLRMVLPDVLDIGGESG
jgi:hypothetical protein